MRGWGPSLDKCLVQGRFPVLSSEIKSEHREKIDDGHEGAPEVFDRGLWVTWVT